MQYREETALEKKLDTLANQIGQVGLGAALFSLVAMASQFSYDHFVAAQESWQWDYLATYLHFLITAITIVVSPGRSCNEDVSPFFAMTEKNKNK